MIKDLRAILKKFVLAGVVLGLVLSLGPSTVRVDSERANAEVDANAATVNAINDRLELAAHVAKGIRTYGSNNGLELVPCLARDRGFQVIAAGAYLTGDPNFDTKEINTLKENVRRGCVTVAILGSNPTQQGYTVPELVTLVQDFKTFLASENIEGVDVTVAEQISTYWINPELANAVDVMMVGIQPYFNQDANGVPFANNSSAAIEQIRGAFNYLQLRHPNTPITVGEVGWPIGGDGKLATSVNGASFHEYVLNWAVRFNVPTYLYSLVDEPGLAQFNPSLAHFGVYGENLQLKDGLENVFGGVCVPKPIRPVGAISARSLVLAEAAPNGCYVAVNFVMPTIPARGRVLGASDCNMSERDLLVTLRRRAIGISSENLMRIPVGLEGVSGHDEDGDQLPDDLEDALGTDEKTIDTDKDSFSDRLEIEYGFSPTNGNGARLTLDQTFADSLKGQAFLAVEEDGEAWYVSQIDGKRYLFADSSEARSWACQ